MDLGSDSSYETFHPCAPEIALGGIPLGVNPAAALIGALWVARPSPVTEHQTPKLAKTTETS
jgi:hypothetical protein